MACFPINIKKNAALLLLGLFVFFISHGQKSEENTYSLNGAATYGVIIRHSKGIGVAGNSFPSGGFIEFNKHFYGDNAWEARHNFPTFGITLSYVDYNSEITGETIGLSPHYTIHINRNRDSRHQFTYKMGFGLGYNTRPYSKDLNHQNHLLGSVWTFSIPAVLGYEYSFNNRWAVSTGLSAIHFSNGSIKKPNKGVNVASLFAGVRFNTSRERPSYSYPEEEFVPKKPSITLAAYGGMNEANYIGAGSRPFLTMSAYVDKKLNHKLALLAGADMFWTSSLKEDIKYDLNVDQDQPPDYKRAALTAGFEYFINKISIVGQLGIYVYDPYKRYAFFYERVGMKYNFTEKLFAGMSIKAHYANGELAEFGGGYRF